MNCTAFGLIVAIPALVAYAIYQNRTDKLVTALTENTTEIFNDLIFLTESDRASARVNQDNRNGVSNRNAGMTNRHPAPNLTV